MVGMMASVYSTTDTWLPSRAYTDPSSRPITPPPTIIRCFGSSRSASASVLVMMRSLSRVMKGRVLGLEPVAMIMFLAVNCCPSPPPPSLGATCTVVASTNEATP